MSDEERGRYRSASPANGEVFNRAGEGSPGRRSPSKSKSFSRSRSRSQSHSRSRSPRYKRKGSYSRSRSHSRSRRHRKSYSRSVSRSRSRSYSPRRKRSYKSFRSRSRSPLSNRKRHQGDRYNPKQSRVLGLFGLSLYTGEKDLKEILNKYGHTERIQVVYDHQTGRSRGFAFVYFKDVDDAVDAKENLNGTELDGRRLRVDYSITKRPHTPTPGVYMGRPTRGDEKDRDSDRGERSERSDRGERSERSERSDRHERSYDRGDRGYDRGYGGDRGGGGGGGGDHYGRGYGRSSYY